MLDLTDRNRLFASLEGEVFDLLVIGGGITGAGIARDAALRGLRVALIEARDFGSGTSSRSTKLVHGGLRYLAQGDIGLVQEAARERKVLARIAPHLARRTELILPAHSRTDVFTRRAALMVFERLGEVAKADHFAVWDNKRLAKEEPALRTGELHGAVVYPEYVTDDARLVIANIRSAAEAGAVVANYAAAREFLIEQGRLVGVLAQETLPDADRTVRIRARVVVNAAGPWADDVRRLADRGAAAKLTLTEGIHLVFGRERLPIMRMVMMTAADGRGIFAVPRGRHAYVGTTDTIRPKAEYWPKADAAEVDYLLNAVNRTFAVAPVLRGDIQGIWAGLRPLIAQAGKGPTEISRKDEIFEEPSGLITIAGGKLTSFRRMAEKIVDLALRRLERNSATSTTSALALPGGDIASIGALTHEIEASGIGRADAERLAALYGSEARAIAVAGGGIEAEVNQAITNEGAVTLEDYWVRRSARAWFPPGECDKELQTAASAMAQRFGWSESERERQILICRPLAGLSGA